MATTINAYSVSLGLNVAGLVEGGKLARSETAAVVRTLKELQDPSEKVTQKINLLEDALNSGAIEWGTYETAVRRLRASLVDNTQAINDQEEALRKDNKIVAEGERLARSLMTAEERHAQELRKINEMYRVAAIGAETYARAVKDANRKLEEANTITATIVEDPPVVKHAKQTETASDSIIKSVKGIVVAYVGLQGLQTAFSALKASSERLDELDYRSQQVGESVPNLQKFSFAMSQLANIDAGTADQMLLRMTRTLGAAKLGSAEAADTFNRLGLDIVQLTAMSPVEQFNAIAAAIAAIPDPALRAAEATKIFGQEGVALLPVFSEGADAVTRLMAEAERLGIVLGADEAAKVAAMNDELDKTYAKFQIIIDRILIAMTPAISAVVSMLQDQNSALNYIPIVIGKMVDGFGFMFAIGRQVQETIMNIGYALYKAAQGDFSFFGKITQFDQINGFLDRWEAAQRMQAQQTSGAGSAAEDEAKSAAEALAAAEAHTKEYQKQVAELEKQILVMERGEVVARQIELAAQGYTDAEIERLETLREQLDEMKRQEREIERINNLVKQDEKDFAKRMEQIAGMKIEGPKGLKQDSTEFMDFLKGQGRQETDKQLKAALEQKAVQDKQLLEQQRANELLKLLADNKPVRTR